MARSSGSSGGSYSYREWAAAERAAQKLRDQQERQAQKDRIAAEARARDKDAAVKTKAIDRRVAELGTLLQSSLARDPRVSFALQRVTAAVPPLDLGTLADPERGA